MNPDFLNNDLDELKCSIDELRQFVEYAHCDDTDDDLGKDFYLDAVDIHFDEVSEAYTELKNKESEYDKMIAIMPARLRDFQWAWDKLSEYAKTL